MRAYRGVIFVAWRVALILGLLLALAFADPMTKVGAITTLEAAINEASGINRAVSTELEAIAAERVVEIQTDWSHDQMQTAEILAFTDHADPIARAVELWVQSSDHWLVMTDRQWNTIGCASTTDEAGVTWLACAFGHDPAQPEFYDPGVTGEGTSGQEQVCPEADGRCEPPVVVMPDTAMEVGS